MAWSSAAGRQSPEYDRPKMRDLRIILLGKSESENSRVGNTVLETEAFDSEVHSSYLQQKSVRTSGMVEKRNISIIKTYHLLHPHLSLHQITQRVRECVSLSAPGPHVILLVLQFNDFSDEDMRRVKTVLNLFSEKAIKHTIVVTTDEDTRTSKCASINTTDNLIKECGGRHLKFDARNPGWSSEMFRKTEEMLKEEEFLICNMYKYGGSSENEDPSRSGGSVRGEEKEEEDYVFTEDRESPENEDPSRYGGSVRGEEKEEEDYVFTEDRESPENEDPSRYGGSVRGEDKEEKDSDLNVNKSVSEFVTSTDSQRFEGLYGSWYNVMELKDQKEARKISEMLDCIDTIKIKPFSVQTYLREQMKTVKELKEKLSVIGNEIKEKEKIKTPVPEGMKLNLVVCGSDRRLKSFISNLILNQKEGSELSSECVRRDVELHGRLISVLELPALFNTQLSEEEVMSQTLRCVSLCDPGVHLFLLIIPDAPINNEDRAEIDKIQKIFSSRINKHVMILIKQNSEERTAELNEETQSVIESFGGRHHFIGPKTQASMLMEKLKQVVEENNDVCFSTETLWDAQMEKLLKFEEMKKRIHSLETGLQTKDARERADDLRIVLLGKTGVGKSATGNTILGREAFTAESSQESVTKECKSESAEINSRRVTVIDTPGLFDTEVSNEEIKREISNCISMILPGPHVFLLLIPVGRFTPEEAKAVKIIQETFGENSLMFTIVLFTRGDDLKNKTIDEYLENPGSAMMNLIEACGNRFHVFNNNQTGDRTQVSDLLKKIDDMVKENGDSYYSCKMFREMEREIQEQQKMMLMERVEKLEREKEELKNKHKEKKRRQEEFRERDEQDRKMQEQMNREREEWERPKNKKEKKRMRKGERNNRQ